jgi:hypothetical protein
VAEAKARLRLNDSRETAGAEQVNVMEQAVLPHTGGDTEQTDTVEQTSTDITTDLLEQLKVQEQSEQDTAVSAPAPADDEGEEQAEEEYLSEDMPNQAQPPRDWDAEVMDITDQDV